MVGTLVSWMVLGGAFGAANAQEVPAPTETPPPAEPAPPVSAPVTYRLDPSRSWLYAVVYNDEDAMAARLGHDHGHRATSFDGKVVWDLADASKCQVEISFPVTALFPDPPGMREREGLDLEDAIGDSAKQQVLQNLQGKSQLDAAHFPTISYRATKCEGTTGAVKVTGDLTIHGVTKSITTTMNVTASADAFAAKGTVKILHSSFGFSPFTNLGGALRNLDEIKLVVDVVGAPAQ